MLKIYGVTLLQVIQKFSQGHNKKIPTPGSKKDNDKGHIIIHMYIINGDISRHAVAAHAMQNSDRVNCILVNFTKLIGKHAIFQHDW